MTADQEIKRKRSSNKYWREIKGNLYARFQYKDENGKPKEKLKRISDKRTARTVVEDMRRELIVHGEDILQSEKMTFEDLAEKYRTARLNPAVFENGIKISGRKSSIDWILDSLIDYFGKKMIRSIKPRDLEAFKSYKLNLPTNQGNKRKIASVNRELEVLRAMLNFAIENDWIIQNPFTKSKGLISKAAEKQRDRVLSFEEENRLLAQCTGPRSHMCPILICALDTAMRRGEIFKLKWKDVDLVNNEILVVKSNSKTEEPRTIGITPRLKKELIDLWEQSPKDQTRLVFGITDTIKTAWKTACRLADVKNFRFHDCRHTATTRMIASGSPHTEVMKITGHTQLKTFLRYLNITSATANRVANKLDDYLEKRKISVDATSKTIN